MSTDFLHEISISMQDTDSANSRICSVSPPVLNGPVTRFVPGSIFIPCGVSISSATCERNPAINPVAIGCDKSCSKGTISMRISGECKIPLCVDIQPTIRIFLPSIERTVSTSGKRDPNTELSISKAE